LPCAPTKKEGLGWILFGWQGIENGELVGAHGNAPDEQSENSPTYRYFKIWIPYEKV
jgi:hypothetical protein